MAARTGFVPVGTARLRVREIGEGPPIVVLHGGPDFDYDYLLPELDRLAARFRLIYYDQRGRGGSAEGVRAEDVTLQSEMEDLDRVRHHFRLEVMSVLGHSWGGVLAMEYAARHPERLTHLILMNTAPATHDDAVLVREHLRRMRPARELEAMQALARTAAFSAGDLGAESAYHRLHFRPAVRDPELLERLLPRLRANFTPERVLQARAIEQRLHDQTWSAPGYDVAARLRRLAVPTLVVHGEEDFLPTELARRVAAAIPGARLALLPMCGHFAYMEAPDAVMHEILGMFSG